MERTAKYEKLGAFVGTAILYAIIAGSGFFFGHDVGKNKGYNEGYLDRQSLEGRVNRVMRDAGYCEYLDYKQEKYGCSSPMPKEKTHNQESPI